MNETFEEWLSNRSIHGYPSEYDNMCLCWNHQQPKIDSLSIQLEEIKTAYDCLKQLVKTYEMTKDVDIDWDDFPKSCVSLCHQENNSLKTELKQAREENEKYVKALDWIFKKGYDLASYKDEYFSIFDSDQTGDLETISEGKTPIEAIEYAMKSTQKENENSKPD